MLEPGSLSKTFSGVRFALVGFNPIDGKTLRSKLLSGGGVDIGQYNQSCTHLIVDKLVYDDPICVAARSSGKVVVTSSWVDHSFDIGMLIDANSVLYRPLKDLNGIPGAKNLIVCLTGYQRQDREDIMSMVDLMGGQFSKPLVANRVTHLICYKFEGEKYELAKRMKRIKLVNHRWLEDCLKNWKLLPEAGYEISGYELEMMEASARDSEDEAEDGSTKRGKTSPLGLRVSAVETSKSGGKDIPVGIPIGSGAQEGSSMGNKLKDNWLTPKKERSLEATVSTDAVATNYAPTIPLNKTPKQEMGIMETDYTTTSINRSIRRHSSLASYSRQTLERSPERNTTAKESSGLKASTAALKSGTTLFEDLDKIDDKLHGEEEIPQAKSTDGSVSNKDPLKIHRNIEASIPLAEESRPVPSINDPTESGEVGLKSPASGLATKLSSSNVVTMEDVISPARDEILERSLNEPMVENILLQEPSSHSPKQDLKVVPSVDDHTEAALKSDLSDSAARFLNPTVVPMEADIRTPETTISKVASDEVAERSISEPVMSKSSDATGSGLIETKEKLETELPKKKTASRKTLGTRGRKKNPINLKGSIYLSEPTPKEISSPVVNTEAVPEMAKHVDSEIEALKGIESADKKSNAVSEEKDHDLIANQDNLQDKTLEEADAEVEITMQEPELNEIPTKDPSEVDKNKRKPGKAATSLQIGKKGGSTKKFSLKKSKNSRKELDAEANEEENLALEDKLEAKTPEEAVAEVGTAMLEPELNDVPSDSAALQLEVDKNKRKRGKETTSSVQSVKKGSSSTALVGKFGVKKTRNSRNEDAAIANEKETAIAEETLAREEAETEEPDDTAMQSEVVDKNKGKRTKKATELQSGKKGSVKKTKKSKIEDIENNSTEVKENVAQSPVTAKPLTRKEAAAKDLSDVTAMEVELTRKEATELQSGKKGSVKKTKKSKTEDDPEANDDTTEVKENVAQTPITKKPLTRKEAAAKDLSDDTAMEVEVEKNKRKRGKEATVEKNSLQSGKKKGRGAKETETVTKDMEDDNSAEEKENVAQTPITKKPLTRKEASAKEPSDDVAMEVEVEKNKRKRGKEATVEKNSLQSGKKKGREAKETETVTKDIEDDDNSAEEKEKIESAKSSVSRKPKANKESKPVATKKALQEQETPKCFIVSGPRDQRKEYQKILRGLKGKCCRDSHQWSYQATHFIPPEIKRTEKFFAAASSGSWILKTDYVADSKEAGKLLPEEPYEWYSTGLSSDGSVSLESPRKWRLVREKTGHGALYGLRIVVYGDCSIPSLDTLKRAVKAGDGTILATAPPYTRFLNPNTDFALISPGTPRDDVWIQEFIRHEIPCVLADYIVEYVCKPGYALDKHVLYNTNSWAERSFKKLQLSLEDKVVSEEEEEDSLNDVACEVCGSKERGEVMMICGDEEGINGCGIGTHIDCCDPPLTHVPQHDWFCSKCSNVKLPPPNKRKKKAKF